MPTARAWGKRLRALLARVLVWVAAVGWVASAELDASR